MHGPNRRGVRFDLHMHQLELRPSHDPTVAEGGPVLGLIGAEGEALVVGRDALLALHLPLDVVDAVAGLHGEGNGAGAAGEEDYDVEAVFVLAVGCLLTNASCIIPLRGRAT